MLLSKPANAPKYEGQGDQMDIVDGCPLKNQEADFRRVSNECGGRETSARRKIIDA
jgi:hypothetical protein